MTRTWVVMLTCSMFCACGTSRTAARDQYVKALDLRQQGDAQAYYDALIAVANAAPDTRAGRRARAVLRSGGGWWMPIYLLAIVGTTAAQRTKGLTQSKLEEHAPELPLDSLLNPFPSQRESIGSDLEKKLQQLKQEN